MRTLEAIADRLIGQGLTWVSQWFHRFESLWSIARKIASASVLEHERVLRLLADERRFAADRWCMKLSPHAATYLQSVLGVSADDVETIWANRMLCGAEDPALSLGFRYCRQCMAHGFHSVLHQLYLINRCPLHDERLLTECPHCQARSDNPMRAMSSYTRCARCGREFFPPERGWLADYRLPESTEAFEGVAAAFSRRSLEGYVESRWRCWDAVRHRTGVPERPAFAVIGDNLRGMGLVIWSGIVPIWSTSSYYEPGLHHVEWMQRAVLGRLSHLRKRDGCDIRFIQTSADNPRRARDVALWLAMQKLGVGSQLEPSYTRRDLNTDLLLGVLGSRRGYITKRSVSVELIHAAVESVYADALTWMLERSRESRWDDWLADGRQLRFPVLWTASPVTGGKSSYELVATSGLTEGVVRTEPRPGRAKRPRRRFSVRGPSTFSVDGPHAAEMPPN